MSNLLIAFAILPCLFIASVSGETNHDGSDVLDIAANSRLRSLVEITGSKAAVTSKRSLLQSGDATQPDLAPLPFCIWDTTNQQCGLNPLVAAGFLNDVQPQSDLRDVVVDVVSCDLSLTEDVCTQNDMCKWINGTCNYAADVTEHETISQCIGAKAAVFLETQAMQKTCSTSYKTSGSCSTTQHCSWVSINETIGICAFDIWKFLTGVPSDGQLPRGLNMIMEMRAEGLAEVLKEAEGIDKPADVLDWERPPFFCPDGVDLLICKIAKEADQFLVTELYCAALVVAGEDCDSDELCSSKDSGDKKCSAIPKIRKDVEAAQREVYLGAIFDPTAAELLKMEFSCLKKTQKKCSSDSCMWDDANNVCTLIPTFLMNKLAEHPAQKPEPICELTKSVLQSGCLQFKSESDCATGEGGVCEWDARDGTCTPSVQVYMDLLFAGDEGLERQAADAILRCKEIDAEGDCK